MYKNESTTISYAIMYNFSFIHCLNLKFLKFAPFLLTEVGKCEVYSELSNSKFSFSINETKCCSETIFCHIIDRHEFAY